MAVIVEYPSEWTREAFEAVVARMRALPADDPRQDELIEAAERNLATFEASQQTLDPAGQAIVEGFFEADPARLSA